MACHGQRGSGLAAWQIKGFPKISAPFKGDIGDGSIGLYRDT